MDGPKKIQRRHDPDQKSELPERLVVEILSLMDVRDAVRTCGVLPRTMKNLWTLVDKINFRCDFDKPCRERRRFFWYVDRTLTQFVCSNIKQFSLQILSLDSSEYNKVGNWVAYICEKKNVKSIKLEFMNSITHYTPPDCFYKNSWLEKLELHGMTFFTFKRPTVTWTWLKTLSLTRVTLLNGDVDVILSGSPALETIILDDVGLAQLNIINSKSVKKLKLIDFHVVRSLVINAPWLQELDFSGNFYGFELQLLNVSSLNIANLTFTHFLFRDRNTPYRGINEIDLIHNATIKLLQSLCHVKELRIGPIFIQALSARTNLPPSLVFEYCEYIMIESPVWKFQIPGIVRLLQSSPNVETFIIKAVTPSEYFTRRYFNETYDFSGHDSSLNLQIRNFPCLKNVKVVHCRDLCSKDAESNESRHEDFKLVAHILSNARLLEKLVVTSQGAEDCRKCSKKCCLQYISVLCHKLLKNCLDTNKWEFKIKRPDHFEFNLYDSQGL